MESYKYEYTDRISFSKCDINNKISLTALIDEFQDSSIFQSEDLGIGFDELRKHQLVWFLNYWEIEIDRLPKLCDRVTIGTFPYDFKSFLGYRNFYMKDTNGDCIVKANTTWTLLNTETLTPTKAPEFIINTYKLGSKLDMTYSPRKIQIPSEDSCSISTSDKRIVQLHHLDGNMHMNNCQYINFALAAIGKDMKIKHLRADYRMQAKLNDIITPVVYETDNSYIVSLNNEEGKPYSVVAVSE